MFGGKVTQDIAGFLQLLFCVSVITLFRESNGELVPSTIISSSTLKSVLAMRSGDVVVSDENTIYLLNANLSQLRKKHKRENSVPEKLTLTANESKLIVCWSSKGADSLGRSLNKSPCYVYNSTDLSVITKTRPTTSQVRSQNDAIGAPKGNTYSVFRGHTDSMKESFFVFSSVYSGGDRRLYHREYSALDSSVKRTETVNDRSGNFRTYHGGVTIGNFTYIVATDVIDDVEHVRIIRICDSTEWDNWYEIEVICRPRDTTSDFRGKLAAVKVVSIPNTLFGGPLMLVAIQSLPIESAVVAGCVFQLSTIDSAADRLLQYCQRNNATLPFPWDAPDLGSCGFEMISNCDLSVEGRQNTGPSRLSTQASTDLSALQLSPLVTFNHNHEVLSSLLEVFIVDQVGVMFTGVPSYPKVQKFTAQNVVSFSIAPEKEWFFPSPITSLTHSPGSDYVYVVTETAVYQLPIEECSNFKDCISCTTAGRLLCGWCTVENKCNRKSHCSNSGTALRWHRKRDKCLSISIASAEKISGDIKSYPREQKEINVSIANLPSTLLGESFECVFGDLGRGNLTRVDGSLFTCTVPTIAPFTGFDTQTKNFSLKSTSQVVDFGQIHSGITFYDCSARNTCTSCVKSLNCNWCPFEFSCKTAGSDCSKNPVKISGSCPLLLPSEANDGKYYQLDPLSQQTKYIVLNAQNLLPVNDEYGYHCELSDHSFKRTVQALSVSSTRVSCEGSQLSTNEYQKELSIRLLWANKNTTKNFSIESSTGMDQRVVVYSCPKLGVDCISCIGLNDNFECAYCVHGDSGSCIPSTTSCSSGYLIQAPNFTHCSAPVVHKASPRSGPVEGGTLYTIKGINLGAHSKENISILFGDKNCLIHASMSVRGSLVCTVPQALSPGMVDVRVARSGNGSYHVGEYRYAIPRINGVVPHWSPTKGGSRVQVVGSDLGIGNIENTKVAVVLNSSDSQGIPIRLPFINVRVISSSSISFTTVGISTHLKGNRNGHLSVSIDGNSYTNDSVLLQYIQPRFNRVSNELLQSGGIPLIVLGINLDAVEQPLLTLSVNHTKISEVVCRVKSSLRISCTVPVLTNITVGTKFEYSLKFGNDVLSNLSAIHPLTAVADPVFFSFTPSRYEKDSNLPLIITGSNLTNVAKADYNVTIGDQPCTDLSIDDNRIVCTPPQQRPNAQKTADVVVTIGIRDGVTLGSLDYLGYTNGASLSGIIVATAVCGGILLALLVIAISICIVCGFYRRSKRKANIQAMELREIVEREREMSEKKQEELKQQVENMASQVNVVHLQMKELSLNKQTTYYSTIKDGVNGLCSEEMYEEIDPLEGYEKMVPNVNDTHKYLELVGDNHTAQVCKHSLLVPVPNNDNTSECSESYMNGDEDPSLNVVLTKSPAYHVPEVELSKYNLLSNEACKEEVPDEHSGQNCNCNSIQEENECEN